MLLMDVVLCGETALEFLEQSIDIAKGISDIDGESRAHYHMGCLYNAMGKYAEGIAMHEHASRLIEQQDHISFECGLAHDASSEDGWA